MATRTTSKEALHTANILANTLTQFYNQASACGLLARPAAVTRAYLETGSKTNGISYRFMFCLAYKDGGEQEQEVPGTTTGISLGMTAQSAITAMQSFNGGLRFAMDRLIP